MGKIIFQGGDSPPICLDYLEVFHSLKIRYLPKNIFFEQDKMIAGAQLAALDHNHNIERSQVFLFVYNKDKTLINYCS